MASPHSFHLEPPPIHVPVEVLDDLRTRLTWTRPPLDEGTEDWSYGVPAGYLMSWPTIGGTATTGARPRPPSTSTSTTRCASPMALGTPDGSTTTATGSASYGAISRRFKSSARPESTALKVKPDHSKAPLRNTRPNPPGASLTILDAPPVVPPPPFTDPVA